MDRTFVLPGTTGPEITLQQPLWSGQKLLVRAEPVPRHGSVRPSYQIPMDDGTTKELRLKGSMFGLKGEVDGTTFEIEPSPPAWQLLLILLPFALAGLGGAMGGLIGGIAAVANVQTFRSSMSPTAKVGTAILNVVIAFVVWYLLASFLVSRLG